MIRWSNVQCLSITGALARYPMILCYLQRFISKFMYILPIFDYFQCNYIEIIPPVSQNISTQVSRGSPTTYCYTNCTVTLLTVFSLALDQNKRRARQYWQVCFKLSNLLQLQLIWFRDKWDVLMKLENYFRIVLLVTGEDFIQAT